MNEQLQEALTELITKATSGIDTAGEFMAAELPEVITQLLSWYAAYNAILFAVSIAIIIAWFFAEKFAYRAAKDSDDTDTLVLGYFLMGSLVRIAPAVIIAQTLNLQWLKIWIAPKIWLIEYAATLVK